MHLRLSLAATLWLSVTVLSQPRYNDASLMASLTSDYHAAVASSLPSSNCTSDNIAVRHEWENLSQAEKGDYIRAVQCLHNSKPKTVNTLVHTRHEEFVLSHINVTLAIHYSALLLPWHRYFIFLYEKALREECGYRGYQPYWDWSKYVASPDNYTLFDGSLYSLGGNGEAIEHGPSNLTIAGGAPPAVHISQPAGTGGGCVVGGPFSNYTLLLDATNQGAASPVEFSVRKRCLTRDFAFSTLESQSNYENVTDTILNSDDIHAFHSLIESNGGIHPGGHIFIGGENNNLFTSPSDPAFFFHHGMLDRVWAIWQSRDFVNRTYALDGTLTWSNYPPTPNATVDDILDMGPLGERRIGDVMSPTDNILCYKYD
ncbi:Tyrosinase-like protein orsC [Colletotrichum spinosum]|uniref:Tyrosinase-like protein orsC n=1 Tax=Colletotrichum spinosum TaxID=1347390 RepID=A0A4V3HSJ2_9PEZI|nr:Tyrosinase-like protein orsC [Colletotrichum spinosum]